MDDWKMQMAQFQENSVWMAKFVKLRRVLDMLQDIPKQNTI
jgi:hypothetical protein